MKVADIGNAAQSEAITAACERLLEHGSIYVFEYCRDYLLKYDKDFITPYIQRYSKGVFTELESEWMNKNFYQKDYVIRLASDTPAE